MKGGITEYGEGIQALVICVFRHNNRILVTNGYDSVKDEYFYRPCECRIELAKEIHLVSKRFV